MNDEKKLPDLGLEVGDIVDYMGVRGAVLYLTLCNTYPICVVLHNVSIIRGGMCWFLPDGRFESWHTTPSLRLIEKKIKPKTNQETIMNSEKKLPDLGFEVGDIVDYMGAGGTVVNNLPSDRHLIRVVFNNNPEWNESGYKFLPDGRFEPWHRTPSLKLIEKKIKPKKVITLYRYTFVGDIHTYQTTWSSDENFKPDGVVVKVETKEVEIDE